MASYIQLGGALDGGKTLGMETPAAPPPDRHQPIEPEAGLVQWSIDHPAAPTLREWLGRIQRWRRTAAFVLLGLMAIAGWFAAHAALGLDRSRPTNIYWLLGGVLLPQTVLLIAWLALTATGGLGVLGASLGGLLRSAVLRLVAGRLGRQIAGVAAVTAMARVESDRRITRWSIALATNALWSAFNLGTLVGVLALLSIQQHTFCWESTILSAEGYRRVTSAVGILPGALGFAVPDAAQIAEARLDPSNPDGFPAQGEAARMAWSGLLVGSVVAYGLGPRLGLALFSAFALWRARRGFRLDLDSQLLAPLAARLTGGGRTWNEGEAPAWETRSLRTESEPGAQSDDGRIDMPLGLPAIVGIELATPSCGWPPTPVSGIDIIDLGRIESREERQSALTAMKAMESPRSLTIIASLISTPDRGLAALLRDLAEASPASPALVLTGGSALRQRGDASATEQRVEGWRELAAQAGIARERVREIDLDALTAASAAALRALVQGAEAQGGGERRIERAAALIAAAADDWAPKRQPPSLASQAELHRSLAALYGAQASGSPWGRLFGASAAILGETIAANVGGDQVAPGLRRATQDARDRLPQLVEQAGRNVISLLPPALRVRPKWIAAGALAGALGCVTVGLAGPAALAAPLALQALPLWSAIGAAIGGVIAAGRTAPASAGSSEAGANQASNDGWATAIRAATLQALIMELQGGGEARLMRAIESALPEPDPDAALLATPRAGAAGRWLDGVRHRLDMSLGRQGPVQRSTAGPVPEARS